MQTFEQLAKTLNSIPPRDIQDQIRAAFAELDANMSVVLRCAHDGIQTDEDMQARASVIFALDAIDRALARS